MITDNKPVKQGSFSTKRLSLFSLISQANNLLYFYTLHKRSQRLQEGSKHYLSECISILGSEYNIHLLEQAGRPAIYAASNGKHCVNIAPFYQNKKHITKTSLQISLKLARFSLNLLSQLNNLDTSELTNTIIEEERKVLGFKIPRTEPCTRNQIIENLTLFGATEPNKSTVSLDNLEALEQQLQDLRNDFLNTKTYFPKLLCMLTAHAFKLEPHYSSSFNAQLLTIAINAIDCAQTSLAHMLSEMANDAGLDLLLPKPTTEQAKLLTS